jgi:hypothetical protein
MINALPAPEVPTYFRQSDHHPNPAPTDIHRLVLKEPRGIAFLATLHPRSAGRPKNTTKQLAGRVRILAWLVGAANDRRPVTGECREAPRRPRGSTRRGRAAGRRGALVMHRGCKSLQLGRNLSELHRVVTLSPRSERLRNDHPYVPCDRHRRWLGCRANYGPRPRPDYKLACGNRRRSVCATKRALISPQWLRRPSVQ